MVWYVATFCTATFYFVSGMTCLQLLLCCRQSAFWQFLEQYFTALYLEHFCNKRRQFLVWSPLRRVKFSVLLLLPLHSYVFPLSKCMEYFRNVQYQTTTRLYFFIPLDCFPGSPLCSESSPSSIVPKRDTVRQPSSNSPESSSRRRITSVASP
jgi:hypothetical protein